MSCVHTHVHNQFILIPPNLIQCHRVYSSLPSIPICNSLLQRLETGFPLSSMYLLIFSSLHYTKRNFTASNAYLWQATIRIQQRESESEVTQSCPALCDPVDCSPPCSSVHGIFQARVLEWVAISFSRGSSRPRDRTQVSRIVSKTLYLLSHQGSPQQLGGQ